MSVYTPTAGDVKWDYQALALDKAGKSYEESGHEFDRWLAEVERAAAEKAYDRGHQDGYKDAQEYHGFGNGCGPDWWDCDCPNPYRRGGSDENFAK